MAATGHQHHGKLRAGRSAPQFQALAEPHLQDVASRPAPEEAQAAGVEDLLRRRPSTESEAPTVIQRLSNSVV